MEIGPTVRALLHHRSRFVLIALEIALTLAIVANCVNMIRDQRGKLLRPTGLDEANLLIATTKPFAPEFDKQDFRVATYEADLRALRALPGVRAATASSAVPLSGGGSSTGRRAAGTTKDTINVPFYVVGTEALETLGVELVAGRTFTEADFAEAPEGSPENQNVIVTQAMADALFPEGNALGKRIENARGGETETIVGILRRMHCSWPLSSVAEQVQLYPGRPAFPRQTIYVVRAEPALLDELHRTVEEKLLAQEPGRIVEVTTLAEVKRHTYRNLAGLNLLLGAVSVLLVAVTALGVVGLTAFSVTERRRQIGTRRALGATRLAILRYFLVENWLVTTFGLAVGVVLTYGLNFGLSKIAETPRIGAGLVVSGMLLMWLIGLLATLLPAVRGSAVPPVVATRTV